MTHTSFVSVSIDDLEADVSLPMTSSLQREEVVIDSAAVMLGAGLESVNTN